MSRVSTPDLPTLAEVRALVADMIGTTPEAVPLDADLHALGVTSIGMMRLANRWRRAGIKIAYADLVADRRLIAWRRYLAPEQESR